MPDLVRILSSELQPQYPTPVGLDVAPIPPNLHRFHLQLLDYIRRLNGKMTEGNGAVGPAGPAGDEGPQGPEGPPGEGLSTGSLDFHAWIVASSAGTATLDATDWRGRLLLVWSVHQFGLSGNDPAGGTWLDNSNAVTRAVIDTFATEHDLFTVLNGNTMLRVYVDGADGGKIKAETSHSDANPGVNITAWIRVLGTSVKTGWEVEVIP